MDKYNPNIHHRKSIRLKGYDYSQAGLYFITICCENREHRFGEIVVGAGFTPAQMILNETGTVAYNEWAKLPERFPNFELDVFQIMPNHMHGIIVLNDVVGVGFTPTQKGQPQQIQKGQPQGLPLQNNDDDIRAGVNPALTKTATIGDIVGAYKSLVTNVCIDICNSKNIRLGKLWQRNYYEHIIRNEQSYQTISNYIINNPQNWNEDKFNS
jgi:putative transposase